MTYTLTDEKKAPLDRAQVLAQTVFNLVRAGLLKPDEIFQTITKLNELTIDQLAANLLVSSQLLEQGNMPALTITLET